MRKSDPTTKDVGRPACVHYMQRPSAPMSRRLSIVLHQISSWGHANLWAHINPQPLSKVRRLLPNSACLEPGAEERGANIDLGYNDRTVFNNL